MRASWEHAHSATPCLFTCFNFACVCVRMCMFFARFSLATGIGPSRLTHVLRGAHDDIIRDLDFNPNKPHHIVTGGNDRVIKVCA